MHKRAPKKSENLELRLPHATKHAFMAQCRREGRSASEVLRGFIDTYLAAGPAAAEAVPVLPRIAGSPAAAGAPVNGAQ